MKYKAIVERVAKEAFNGKWSGDIRHAFHKVGIFDLLEAAEEIEAEFGYCIPPPYITRLRGAIAKITGGETSC